VETLKKSGGDFLVCESEGSYRFVADGALKVYSSDYTCQFADIGARFALTGSYDAKTVRILKKADFGAADLLDYAADYAFSEVKLRPASPGRAAFYSYEGLRLCDLAGKVVAEVSFPAPLSVINTEYDKTSGNIAVIYEDAFRLYDGLDGNLLSEKYGKRGVQSVVYTPFGVSVLSEDGAVTLYDLATGGVLASADAGAEADRALPVGGGLLVVRDGGVFFDGRALGAGDLIGAGPVGADAYAFALSDGTDGKVFFVEGGALREAFSFSVTGRAEAYFTGGFVFVSPRHGGASAYTSQGRLVRVFDEKGYLAETGALGDRITASYIVATSERYSLLLDGKTLETVAVLPGFLGERDDATPVLDDGAGRLRAAKIRSLPELTEAAWLRLDGRVLTQEEKDLFKAG
jgi:hypothetical protein